MATTRRIAAIMRTRGRAIERGVTVRPAGRMRALLGLVALVLATSVLTQWARKVSLDRIGEQVAASAQPGDIQMISSDSCVFCGLARTWFQNYRIPFEECSIERDAKCAASFNALMAPGTPLLLVRGESQIGFSPERVLAALTRTAP